MQQIPTWIVAIGAILAILGAVTAIVRGLWRTDSIAGLRSDNADLRDRIKDRDDEIADLKIKVADLTTEVNKLRQAIQTLERMKSASDQIDQLARHLDDHHRESMAAWARLEEAIK